MSTSFRRFEILLPLRFNDGRPVPDELIADTINELREYLAEYLPKSVCFCSKSFRIIHR
jgi:hypothetical protein